MKKKEDRRIAMTKRMLKNALTEMLKETDIYHITVRELCDRADINRTTFYKHYGNQFELLDDMESDLLDMVEKTIKTDNNNCNTIEKLLIFLEDNIEFVELLLNANIDPAFPQKLFSLAIIESSIESIFPNVPKNEYEYIYHFVLYGIYEMIRHWLNKEQRETPKYMSEIIHERLSYNFNLK